MEVLSGVASGMAVASLSLQLLQSINTVRTFVCDVKGAPKELQRLAALLDQLHALLETIRDMLERQTSLQDQHFPAPAPMIFDALRSCELSLEPLCSVVEKYGKEREGKSSSLARLKDDIKIGLKTKDIARFEAQIQREIEYLHTALSVNSTSFLMSTMPAMLQNQRTCMTVFSQTIRTENTVGQIETNPIAGQFIRPKTITHLPKFRRKYWASYALRRFGIHQRGSAQYIGGENNRSHTNPISESHEILLVWGFLNFGLRWSRHYPYRRIISSLSTYPVIPNLFVHIDLIRYATIDEIQQTFHSGALHPFTRDLYGLNLLDLSALFCRPDIYRLLLNHGLKPVYTEGWDCILGSALVEAKNPKDRIRRLDTLRLLLAHESDQFEDLSSSSSIHYTSHFSMDAIEWVWHNVACVLQKEDVVKVRFFLLRRLLTNLSNPKLMAEHERLVERTAQFLDIDMEKHYLCGGVRLIQPLFYDLESSIESGEIGSLFTELLSRCGFDVQACIRSELDQHSYIDNCRGRKKIIFEPKHTGEWSLRWEWALDDCSPGYLLASEHIAFGPDAVWLAEWPFGQGEHELTFLNDDIDAWEQQNFRAFERRMNNKVCKERAKARRKQGIKVPGAWI